MPTLSSIESDNLEIMEAIWNGWTIDEIAVGLDDIRYLKRKFRDFVILWTQRGGSHVAHQVAHIALTRTLPEDWLLWSPPSLVQCLVSDKEAWAFSFSPTSELYVVCFYFLLLIRWAYYLLYFILLTPKQTNKKSKGLASSSSRCILYRQCLWYIICQVIQGAR